MQPGSWILFVMVAICSGAKDLDVALPKVQVRKCCEKFEVLYANCQHVNVTDSTPWEPLFYDVNLHPNAQVLGYEIQAGFPECGPHELRRIHDLENLEEQMFLMTNGVLRHCLDCKSAEDEGAWQFYDYQPDSFCIEKSLEGSKPMQVALVCVPDVRPMWDATSLVLLVVNPLLHIISIICLLAVAIVYFVLPALRDLVGNILSSIAVCLIISQIASLVNIFTDLTNHVSFIVADVIMYLSLLAAFFWLTGLGFYIWRTFRSRNVFLRVSDGRKYCYYSSCIWGATLTMTLVAIVAHFLFHTEQTLHVSPHGQDTIGWLGIAVFFTPIAFTIIIDIFFYLTTARAISRMATYGRIHSRMKFSFELFIQLFLVMSTAWLFLMLSWLNYTPLIFTNIVVNSLQAPLILFICVAGQKNVRSLLKKTCCQGDNEPHWGEEMMSMTSN